MPKRLYERGPLDVHPKQSISDAADDLAHSYTKGESPFSDRNRIRLGDHHLTALAEGRKPPRYERDDTGPPKQPRSSGKSELPPMRSRKKSNAK